jgi:hypothetical protein
MSRREIGGNNIQLWYGRLLSYISTRYGRRSQKFLSKGRTTIISNPTCKFINHCTLIFNFTINEIDKYQLIQQGNYSEKYKLLKSLDKDSDVCDLNEVEMFSIIVDGKSRWFKK